jgi:hypothetical protein
LPSLTLYPKDTSFGSDKAFYEGAQNSERPYTSSLGPPPRWDQRASPEPSDVISDAGDQQELQLRQKQTGKYHSIEQSLASLPSDDSQDDFQTKIYNAFQQARSPNAEFLPRGMLCNLVNPDSVSQELRQKFSNILTPEAIQNYTSRICSETQTQRRGKPKIKSFRKIFALLVLIESTESILKLLEEDVSDLDLPLTLVKHQQIDGFCRRDTNSQNAGAPLQCLRRPQWSLLKLRNFAEYQWKLLAPFFSQDIDNDVKHYKLDDHHVLPFLALNDMAEKDTERLGGYGRVILVDIHPDHHSFPRDRLCNRGFAIKQQIDEEHRNAFKKEIDILKKFSGQRSHPHIVSLLATYEQFKKFHLIFYRAEGDLMTFWKELKRRPTTNKHNVLWMVAQCRGLADGLLRLHRLLTLPKSQGGAQEERAKNLNGMLLPKTSPSLWQSTLLTMTIVLAMSHQCFRTHPISSRRIYFFSRIFSQRLHI